MPGDGQVDTHDEKIAAPKSELRRPVGRQRHPLTALVLALAAIAVISAVTYIAAHTGEADRSPATVPPPASRELLR